jgi:hypothetical protein
MNHVGILELEIRDAISEPFTHFAVIRKARWFGSTLKKTEEMQVQAGTGDMLSRNHNRSTPLDRYAY